MGVVHVFVFKRNTVRRTSSDVCVVPGIPMAVFFCAVVLRADKLFVCVRVLRVPRKT